MSKSKNKIEIGGVLTEIHYASSVLNSTITDIVIKLTHYDGIDETVSLKIKEAFRKKKIVKIIL